MNSRLRRTFSSKFITISIITLIALLYTGNSVIYAKKDPNGITNQPHDYNKFICGTRADHSLHSKALLLHTENVSSYITPSDFVIRIYIIVNVY